MFIQQQSSTISYVDSYYSTIHINFYIFLFTPISEEYYENNAKKHINRDFFLFFRNLLDLEQIKIVYKHEAVTCRNIEFSCRILINLEKR